MIELIVVVAIIALLLTIMGASLAKARMAGKSFVCKNQLKNVAFDFILFADDFAHPWRGDSDKLGRAGFYIEDFQERQYQIAEFWKVETISFSSYSDGVKLKASEMPLMCPAGPHDLSRKPSLSCRERAIVPVANVSMGFNMRLDQASVGTSPGPTELAAVRLTKRILARPDMPLVFDVDAEAALAKDIDQVPYYSAPPTNAWDDYASGKYWFPSLRHGGRCNAAFIGGHVLSSLRPEREPGWDWKYQPPVE